jgi:hypothetical protein
MPPFPAAVPLSVTVSVSPLATPRFDKVPPVITNESPAFHVATVPAKPAMSSN